ncbi:A1pp-domain-containing protein [Ceraceosorus guamensis]|uniref:A1pp-domain-containing protein n=1 Tax=Ceraceosorus guamensis TaxID=1522189 RepID=A0A316W2W2_9BASI|nr:A1pp-domain-containing protein [Ceraceosorus guamensis]PWN43438.1 A1pp-domain-containing protein [Ceraceosorus guamensis]
MPESVALQSIPTLSSLFKSGRATISRSITSASPSAASASKIRLYQGDITTLEVDSIVNAANHSLLGGGGVDGAIHRRAGEELLKECRGLNGCDTGDAKVTKAYDLPAMHIVHTVGPVFSKKNPEKSAKELRSAYRRSLEEASKLTDVKSIAFPSISTGVYGYPVEEATHIALSTVASYLNDSDDSQLQNVVFCTFSAEDYDVYLRLAPEHFHDG